MAPPPVGITPPYSQGGGYPLTGSAPQVGGYPPTGSAPQGGYPPAGSATHGGYPPAGSDPQGGYPPAGDPPAGHNQPAGTAQGDPSNEAASAPPMEKMDQITGYSQNNFDNDYMAPPPSYDQATAAPPARDASQARNIPTIDEAQARESLIEEVGKHCCWGKGPAQKMTFTSLNSTSAFHYTLETFTEGRATKWTLEPYHGQPINGMGMGPAPLPWNVLVPPPTMFTNRVHKQEVPNTASVKPCHLCYGSGRTRCSHCHGRGNSTCNFCHGSGDRAGGDQCHSCNGRGNKNCSWCHSSGFQRCKTCEGRGSLKCYILLTVTWTNHFEDRVADVNNLPAELMRGVSGEIALHEENQRVWPINHFPDHNINTASNELVSKHQHAYPNARIIMQRHKVRIIPVTEAKYTCDSNTGVFYVYGFENKAHAPDYPSTCCGCCVIL